MSALELSLELDINRSTVYRNLNAMKEELIVIQNLTNKKFSIGPTAYHIGATYLSNFDETMQIRYILNRIAIQLKQSVGYSKLVGDKIINIIEIETYQPIKIGYRQGGYFPFNRGAYGKCIMAFYEPREEMEQIIRRQVFEKKTINTITDHNKLLEEYSKIRDLGYAISDEENLYGVIGIGAPVKNSRGVVVGSIATAVVKTQVNEKYIERLIILMIEGAREISQYII
jgi:DNA-binding IclR family transcriptional regulator